MTYRATTAQWHAERSACRPKQAKLMWNKALHSYVQDRLSGIIMTSNGVPVAGPAVSWNGRRHGRRQHRRWARAWSPEQIARRRRSVRVTVTTMPALIKRELELLRPIWELSE